MSDHECPSLKFKSAWEQYGGKMFAGALCALLGLLIGVWATKDITLTIKDKPCQVSPCQPSVPEPVKPAPCPCKPAPPRKPGDFTPTGQFEAGSGCECEPGKCDCHKKITERDQGPISISWIDPTAAQCDCPKCCCYPCPQKSENGKCACPNCCSKGKRGCHPPIVK